MGQTSSSHLQTRSAPVTPRRKSNVAPDPPPPQSPKIPNYVVPENKVLPNGTADVDNIKRLLRPVSQELTHFHPEFADIFSYSSKTDNNNGDDGNNNMDITSNKENNRNVIKDIGRSQSLDSDVPMTNGGLNHAMRYKTASLDNILNGKLPNKNILNGAVSNENERQPRRQSFESMNSSGVVNSHPDPILRRSNSVDWDNSRILKNEGNRRRPSLGNGIQEPTIFEDPREHLYNLSRQEAFSNVIPGQASLPVQSSFDLDYTFNVTYAQLAEHRRQRRMNEMEEDALRKLETLEAEMKATSNVPKSPFDRQNLGGKSYTRSVSTGSSDTGLSKSKKRRAPQPPRDKSPGRLSLDVEPPADYEMEDSSLQQTTKPSVQRSSSSASYLASKRPVPLPLPKPKVNQQILSRASSVPLTPAPPSSNASLSLPNASASPVQSAITENKSVADLNIKADSNIPGESSLKRSIMETKAQIEALKKLEDILKSASSTTAETAANDGAEGTKETVANDTKPTEDTERSGSDVKDCEGPEDVGTQADSGKKEAKDASESTEGSVSSAQDAPPGLRRMSSLLQHDIVLAAQARGAKVVKSKPPTTLERPKDISEMFREELAKAANAREERRKEASVDNSGSSSRNSSRNSNVIPGAQVDVQSPKLRQRNGNDSHEETVTKPLKTDGNKNNGDEHSNRVFSPSWTPEEDLSSDDDIMDERVGAPEMPVPQDAVKSPSAPQETEQPKKTSKHKNSKGEKHKNTDNNEKSKFGSIRKFKKSVHESVRNAVGSVSKASGKLLKRRKSQDLSSHSATSTPMVNPKVLGSVSNSNWEFANGKTGHRRSLSDIYSDSAHENHVSDSDTASLSSDNDSDDYVDNTFPRSRKSRSSRKAEREKKKDLKNLKRAGVAYVSGKGQIIVLPEGEDGDAKDVIPDNVTPERPPRMYRKKDKRSEPPPRQSSRSKLEELVSKEIREKERLIELERLKQLEMESDFRRLRDLETQERLQRMQTESLQQQISMLQQQQLQSAHAQLGVQNNFVPVNSGTSPAPNLATLSSMGSSPSPLITHTQPLVSNIPARSHQQFSMAPAFPNTQPVVPAMPASMETSVFSVHTAPIVNSVSNTLATSGVGGLSAMELSYLSEYMRMMGVTPPSTQHQWSLLLSSFKINSSDGLASFGAIPLTNMTTRQNGPDVSHLFAPSAKNQLVSVISGKQTSFPKEIQRSVRTLPSGDMKTKHVTFNNNDQRIQANHQGSQQSIEYRTSDNVSGVVRVNVPDHGSDDVNGVTMETEESITDVTSTQIVKKVPPAVPPKVYGPVGFRPIAFAADNT